MAQNAEDDRLKMINEQIESRGIRDRLLLSALEKVPRHLFVPPEYRDLAYTDQALPSYCGQTISQPYIVAKMTELLTLDKSKNVLEIGTGTGYQTGILAELAGEVYTMEIVPDLHKQAQTNLSDFKFTNIHFILDNGYEGYPAAAPYDAIIVTAAPPIVPEKLTEQLATGGRMVIPVGEYSQMLYLLTKGANGILTFKEIFPVVFIPMRK